MGVVVGIGVWEMVGLMIVEVVTATVAILVAVGGTADVREGCCVSVAPRDCCVKATKVCAPLGAAAAVSSSAVAVRASVVTVASGVGGSVGRVGDGSAIEGIEVAVRAGPAAPVTLGIVVVAAICVFAAVAVGVNQATSTLTISLE